MLNGSGTHAFYSLNCRYKTPQPTLCISFGFFQQPGPSASATGMGVPRLRMDKGSLWTGVVLLTLTCGVGSMSPERLPALIGAVESEPQDPSLYALFRELYEQQLLRQMMAQPMEQPPEPEPEQQKRAYYEHVPLPLALHVGDTSREEMKRASSYMALCHFKICSVGRKRSNARMFGRFRK